MCRKQIHKIKIHNNYIQIIQEYLCVTTIIIYLQQLLTLLNQPVKLRNPKNNIQIRD